MTRINDYLWQLPHPIEENDPPDVAHLAQSFNLPITTGVERVLSDLGYTLSATDIIVPPDSEVHPFAEIDHVYAAHVRFINYLHPDVILRVHFEHLPWSVYLPGDSPQRYVINLDRFKLTNIQARMPETAWPGRLHTRMSSLKEGGLEHSGEDQVWSFSSSTDLGEQIGLFLDKFTRWGHPWLADEATFGT